MQRLPTTTSLVPFERLLQDTRDGIFVLDRDRRFVLFSPGCERLTGFRGEDVVGGNCSCHSVVECSDPQGRSLAGALCPVRRFLDDEADAPEFARQRMRLVRRDGSTLWVETVYAPLRDADGRVELILGVMRDAAAMASGEPDLVPGVESLRGEVRRLAAELRDRYGLPVPISRSTHMRPAWERIRAAVRADSPVLISGPPGGGQDVVARLIHEHGHDRAGPFVVAACGAWRSTSAEATLFGHGDGGLWKAAGGGTLFLDEINRLPHEMQFKLQQQARIGRAPVGGVAAPRLIAACDESPGEAVSRGRLRQDLFYALSVVTIELPPLRARPEDVPLLVVEQLDRLNQSAARQVVDVSPRAWHLLTAHDWPGDVRELVAAVQSAHAVGDGPILRAAVLPATLQRDAGSPAREGADGSFNLDSLLARVERQAIHRALQLAGGQRQRAAKLMGVSRSRLYRRMEALRILPARDEPDHGEPAPPAVG